MSEHLPILQIVVPMLAAPVCVLLRQRHVVQAFGLLIGWVTFGISVALLKEALVHGTVRYQLGGWAAPWGIEYSVDPLAGFVVLFVAGIGALSFTYLPKSISTEIPEDRQYLFVPMMLLCLSGLLGIVVTGDLFNVFVFLEVSSLSSYALIALGRNRRALTATFSYLILGTLGATFYLIGVGLMYMMTGTLNLADMATRLPEVADARTIHAAFAFLTVGIGLKMGLFPLHVWLPNAYTYAPSVVTVFLAATATKVSVYLLIRVVFTMFGAELAFATMRLEVVLLPLALLGIFVGSIVAIFQTNVKRMLAYSSIAQIGYMALGLCFVSVSGLTAGIVHLFNHALTKGALFMALGGVFYRLGTVELADLRGIGKRMPWTMFLWVMGGLSLIGVPATAGFISKWYLIKAALELGWWPVAALVLLSSLLAVVYVWRVVEVAYFDGDEPQAAEVTDGGHEGDVHGPSEATPSDGEPATLHPVGPDAGSNGPTSIERREAPLTLLIPTAVLIAATLYFGVVTRHSAGIAEAAARMLLERGGMP